MKLKKIVAREGLVILGIILFSLSLSFVSNQFDRPRSYLDIALALKDYTQDETEAVKMTLDLRRKYPQYNDLTALELTRRMAEKYPEWVNVYKIMQGIDKKSIDKGIYNGAMSKPRSKKVEKLRDMLASWSLNVLLFGYPFYLLIRFIIWAVRTLREK